MSSRADTWGAAGYLFCPVLNITRPVLPIMLELLVERTWCRLDLSSVLKSLFAAEPQPFTTKQDYSAAGDRQWRLLSGLAASCASTWLCFALNIHGHPCSSVFT